MVRIIIVSATADRSPPSGASLPLRQRAIWKYSVTIFSNAPYTTFTSCLIKRVFLHL